MSKHYKDQSKRKTISEIGIFKLIKITNKVLVTGNDYIGYSIEEKKDNEPMVVSLISDKEQAYCCFKCKTLELVKKDKT